MWAFGCVLYELLTGKQAFEGETVTDTLAAVLKTEPDWNRLPATTPASIRVLLRRCLQKDLKRRLRDATDARIEIEDALAAPPAAEAAAVALHARSTRNVWRWALVSGLACLVAAALTGIAVWNLRTPPRQAVRQLAITLPNDVPLANLDRPVVAISPDGGHLAYVAIRGGTQQIFLRALDSLEAKTIEGTEGAIAPFFSPDGRWLGFFSGNSLKKISITGGASVTLCNFGAAPNGASWGANDIIAFSGSAGVGLSQVSAAGGTPQALTKVDAAKDERFHLWPQLLPGAKAVLFTVITPSQEARIAVQQLETGERKILIQGGHYGRYLPSGHLAYVRAGTLMAAPFDLKRLEVTRPAVPVVDRIMESRTGAQFSISDQGSLVYISGGASGEAKTLVWVDRKGAEQPVGAPPRPYAWPRLSPDGRLLAVALQQTDIWVYDIPRGNPSRLTFEGASTFPIWSPDGRRIAFASAREGKAPNLFWKPADGSGPDERLTTSQNLQYPATWSPDGQVIGFAEMDAATGLDLWALPLSDRKPRLFLRTPSHEFAPKFSPDGRWLAYGSNESGRPEIYVQPFPGPGGKWQISTDGGQEVLWARTGEMFYRSGNRMMAVETKTQPAFSASAPRMLFEGPYELLPNGSPNYDVTADGQRFLMVKAASPETAPTQINVVLNWLEELKQRVPVK